MVITSLLRDELYKSGIVFNDPKDLKTKEILSESKIDVLKTIVDAETTLNGFAQYEDTIVKDKVSKESLILFK